MRHFLAQGPTAAAIAGLPGGVVAAAAAALLVAPTGGPHRGVPRLAGTGPRAVAIAPVAPAAEKEHLAAVDAVADDEPERVHAPHGPDAGDGQSRPDMGRQGRAESTRPARFGPRARGGKTPGPHPPASSARPLYLSTPSDRKRTGPRLAALRVTYPEFRAFWRSPTGDDRTLRVRWSARCRRCFCWCSSLRTRRRQPPCRLSISSSLRRTPPARPPRGGMAAYGGSHLRSGYRCRRRGAPMAKFVSPRTRLRRRRRPRVSALQRRSNRGILNRGILSSDGGY